MTIRNPFSQPDPHELQQFAESVSVNAPGYGGRLLGAIGKTRAAVGGVLGSIVNIPLLGVEKGLQLTGWLGGAMTGVVFRTSKLSNDIQRGIHGILAGKDSVGGSGGGHAVAHAH